MDLTKLHTITNSYQDVRLISLKNWKSAGEIAARDHGGPYVISQEGYAPKDLTCEPDEFLLSRSGEWLSLGLFFRLPPEVRRREFMFGTVAEVIQLLEGLPSDAVLWEDQKASDGGTEEKPEDRLKEALAEGTKQPLERFEGQGSGPAPRTN
jgi:hypothetical protein